MGVWSWCANMHNSPAIFFASSHQTIIGHLLENASLVRTRLFTQIRNKFLRRRGNLRPLFNCLYDLSDQTQTVTTYDMENCCQS